jgi:hypothetical protein
MGSALLQDITQEEFVNALENELGFYERKEIESVWEKLINRKEAPVLEVIAILFHNFKDQSY